MKRTAAFLVEHRKILLALFLALAAVSLLLMGQVNINYDLTEYLPANSRMKDGMARMEQEFGKEYSSELRVLFRDLPEEKKAEIGDELTELAQPASLASEAGEGERSGYTLYTITTEYDAHSADAAALFRAVHEKYDSLGALTGGSIHEANTPVLPLKMVVIAVGLVLLILFIMCRSWFEPVVFMVNIGIAVAINLGTNIIFTSISEYTAAIVGIMQLVLSMDYSIILLNRYTQEKETGLDNLSAMKAAIAAAFPAVAGSSLTTFAGLSCLMFMSFGLGGDMGLALAKSVIISMICIFTVLPSLILMSDRLIVKTRKRALDFRMTRFSRFAVKRRVWFIAVFLIIFIGAFILKNNTEILYMLQTNNAVDAVFEPKHTLVLLYEKRDSDRIAEVLSPFDEDQEVDSIAGYYNTLGKTYSAEEIASLFGEGIADPAMIQTVYTLYGTQKGIKGEVLLTPAELVAFLQESVLNNPIFSRLIPEETKGQIAGAGDMIAEGAARLEGKNYGRVMLTVSYPEDSAETRAFIQRLTDRCGSMLEGETWMIGSSVMNAEMAETFDAEMTRITLLSVIAIFIVVALTFRSLVIPLILVMTVQCGIYLTMTLLWASGSGMYYLALLMVQCILMGATIDYAILYTSYYRECRKTMDRREAILGSCEGALHTILTSALIMIGGAGILGFVFANPAIGEVCLTISRGAICATALIVFVLPGVLAALDRFIRQKKPAE